MKTELLVQFFMMKDFLCVNYADQNNANINASPAYHPLLPEANEETPADNREDQNTARGSRESSGVYTYLITQQNNYCRFDFFKR